MKHTLEESEVFKKQMASKGAKMLMGGKTIEYHYRDTLPMPKVIIEGGSGHAIELKPAWVYP